MIVWLWIGGATMAAGTLLAAFPTKGKRRPTDPVSAPTSADDTRRSDTRRSGTRTSPETEQEVLGV
jgi:hypothetical protein